MTEEGSFNCPTPNPPETETATFPDRYLFADLDSTVSKHQDGTEMPRLEATIERFDPVTGGWMVAGYVTVRLQKVKRTGEEVEDIAVISTVRINPQVVG